MIAFRLYKGVAHHLVFRWPEWILSAMLCALGVRLLLNVEAFASSSGYRVMATIADEDTWAALCCVVAGLRLLALTVNGTFRPFARWSPIVRSGLGMLSAGVWFCIALSVYLANPGGFGWIAYGGLMFADMMNSMLAAGDAGEAERRHRNGRTR